jgi:site-specific recombinase XerD
LYEHQREVLDKNAILTAEGLKNIYLGIGESRKSILEVFEYHNEKIKSQIGKDYSVATHKKFIYTLNHLSTFIKIKYKRSDLFLYEINSEFVNEFDYYLRVTKKCNNNTTVKYVNLFKKIIGLALAHGWLDKNPFLNYKQKAKEVEREFLLEHELKALEEKDFSIRRLQQVKEVFIFCCYTGLAYVDVAKLTRDNIVLGIDRHKWIKQNRTKTDTRSSIPILPAAEAILDKYIKDPYCVANSKILPVGSNQKMNAYLKEIADLCGITKNCTMHLARHTFATTVTLTNGVSLERVSGMLGHRSIKTTQHYAKIVDRRLSDDMIILKNKLSKNITQKVANIV